MLAFELVEAALEGLRDLAELLGEVHRVWDNPSPPMKMLRFLTAILVLTVACSGADRAPSPEPDASSTLAAPTTAGCGVGTWVFNENGSACGDCVLGISDFVTLTVPPGMVDGGGAVSDSEGNTWVYDPLSCTLTTTGSCGIADTIDFNKGTSSCAWTCGQACPACAGRCSYARF